jgi:hypothetical protein
VTFDNANVRSVLGLTPTTDMSRAWLASAYSLIRHGMVPDKTRGKVLSTGAGAASAGAGGGGAPSFDEFSIPAVVAGLPAAGAGAHGTAPGSTGAAAAAAPVA